MVRALLFVICMTALVAGCDRAPVVPEPVAPAFKAETIAIFPEATEARLYAFEEGLSGVGGGSKPQVRPDHLGGVRVTNAELAQLKGLLKTDPDTEDPAACACVFRHVVGFFDARGAKLGELALCLGCGCVAVLEPPDYDGDIRIRDVAWDENVVRAMLEAHHVPTFDPSETSDAGALVVRP